MSSDEELTEDGDKELTEEFVVHDYDSAEDRVRRERLRHGDRPGELPERRERSELASMFRWASARLRAAASGTTADDRIAHAADSVAGYSDSVAETIEEDGLRGIGDRTADFLRSNSKAAAASAAALALLAVRAWQKDGRSGGK